ncbi:pantoate--beta-alanine ligase [Halovulum marinum]|uniref:pantoate--beta-alanine ligase n=1 Tax=Halovulum marinum TaxID=2662447 RepID=UPI002D774495|nr:pantoate--beta-alanine ligase [Halovulum marinum]
MDVIRTVPELAARVAAWREDGERIGLVPTMGGLHGGHTRLIRAAKERDEKVVLTLFVNPTQFGPDEDLAGYPRSEAEDLELARIEFVDLAFVPEAAEMYPPGFSTRVQVDYDEDVLCAADRPGHFDGVAQAVTKLLNLSRADSAYFGEKDWQQLQIVRKLVRDLNIATRIVGVPTVREGDGLAMSTRNRTLGAEHRAIAPRLFAEITRAASRIAQGEPTELACVEAAENLIIAGFSDVEYLECRDAERLRIAPSPGHGARVFAAARLGGARLIDNVPVPDLLAR